MRRQAKLTSKGQITIPRDIRRVLQLHKGDVVIFETDGDGVRLRTDQQSVFARYNGAWREGNGQTLEEVLEEIRELRGDIP